MKKRLLILATALGTLIGSVVLYAATHITTGGTLPAVCNTGDIFAKTGGSAGLYRCSAANTWTQLADATGGGFVTASGTLTANRIILGNGTTVVTALGSLGTTTTLLHGNAAGAPSFAAVSLTADVTGTLAHGNGGIDITTVTDDNIIVANGSAWESKAIPNCTDTGGNHLNYTTATNTLSCGTSGGGGSAALSGITAATTTNTIASGNNHSQIWNWALTTNTISAMTFGETTAATGGTASNQSIVDIATLATSTAVPLIIDNAGAGISLRVNDSGAGDTSAFIVDSAGAVCILCNQSALHSDPLFVTGTSSYIAEFGDATFTLGLFYSTSTGGLGTFTNHDLNFFTNNGNQRVRIQKGTGSTILWRQGTPPTSISTGATGLSNTYLAIGGDEFTTNGLYNIGFGYASATVPPAMIGFIEINNSNNTYGDLMFYTRSVNTDTAPTERMRIVNDGGVLIADLKTTGSATGKKVVCVDTTTGKLYASSTGTDCSN